MDPRSQAGLRPRGMRVVLTGGNDSAELDYVSRIASSMQDALNLAGELTLSECANVIASATAYVGPDTALTHMAAALGTPTLALFGRPIRCDGDPGHEATTRTPIRGNVSAARAQAM